MITIEVDVLMDEEDLVAQIDNKAPGDPPRDDDHVLTIVLGDREWKVDSGIVTSYTMKLFAKGKEKDNVD